MKKAPYFAVGLTVTLALASGAFLAAKDSLAFDPSEAFLFELHVTRSATQGALQRSNAKATAVVDSALPRYLSTQGRKNLRLAS